MLFLKLLKKKKNLKISNKNCKKTAPLVFYYFAASSVQTNSSIGRASATVLRTRLVLSSFGRFVGVY